MGASAAARNEKPATPRAGTTGGRAEEADAGASGYSRVITLVNADGLHARPAAELVKLASTFPQKVTVNGTDAKSLLGIMSLGLTKGARVEIASDDSDGTTAVDAIADLAMSGFGEE